MTTETKPTFAPGSWQETLDKSATLLDRSDKGRAKASAMLWEGAQSAIEEWLDKSDVDVHAEVLYADVLDILGKHRKGDTSKIKTVALAVKSSGLVLANFPNLSQAYAEAKRLTVTAVAQADEDTAADEAVQSIEAPKTATTVEAAAKILLSKGVDEAVRIILDVLNGAATDVQNTPAHRSFLRSVAQEINGRATKEAEEAKAKSEAERKAKADAAEKARKEKAAAAKKTAAKKTAAKKTTAAKPKPKPRAEQVEEQDEVAEDEVVEPEEMFADEVETDDSDIDDLLDGSESDEEPEVAPAPAKTKPKPVRRGPVRR